MLPNRNEPGTLWLDHALVLETLDQKQHSAVHRMLADKPPSLILWTYRMIAIEPVVGPLIDRYALYDTRGNPLASTIEVDGRASALPVTLSRGTVCVTLRGGRAALLLPRGAYSGRIAPGRDNPDLFERDYD